ncbi:hypothetical protein ACP70R_025703 [Stipagrostis hirtigluma subsp. patula]
MLRYQIRNEYGLSDPELYAAPGEEDDPEALLEGVAMAGLVGVLRQLGDLAEFAAEIFHDLHEEVMATASRGHGLMLRLQQLEADFPAVEKAIISQTDTSNYPHDDGFEWHTNLQLKQNMITQGDMPRFILDSYEECRGPPHLFTLDKFDVAGAGASLKRYSDPSFFKTEHASNMMETDDIIEKRPRRIKRTYLCLFTQKKPVRWRKGVTLESLLIANSEPQTTSKDRASRKVPPRTTKLKTRHPRDPDHKTTSRICREHLQELISSQQKILANYCTGQYHVKFRSTDSSETSSPFGELGNSNALTQTHGKLELSKVVPVNESDTVETASAPTNGSTCLEMDDKQCPRSWNGPSEVQDIGKMPLVQQNGMALKSEKLQERPNFLVCESSHRLQSENEEKLQVATVPADQDVDCSRFDDIDGDQDSFVDALNNMDSEGEADLEKKNKLDANANREGDELNCQIREGEKAVHAQFPEQGPSVGSSPGLNGSCSGGESTCVDLPLISDCAPKVSNTNGPNSGSHSDRQLNGVDWTNDEEPCNDDDLMDVSSSSSVLSVNADFETNDDLVGCQQYKDRSCCSSNDDHTAVTIDNQSPKTSGGADGLATSNNDYTEKGCHSGEHGQKFVLDGTSVALSKPNDVSQDQEITVGNADDSFLYTTLSNQEQIQELKKQSEEGTSLDTCTSPGRLALLSDKDHAMHMDDFGMDIVAVPEVTVEDTTPTGLDPDDIHEHLDGVQPPLSSMHDNILYESHDDDNVEDLHILPVDETTCNKHVAEDKEIVVLEQGTCLARLNSYSEDSMQATVVARDFTNVEELLGVSQDASHPQDDTTAHVGETLASSPCVLENTLKIGVPLAPNTSSLLDTNSSCMEQHTVTETERTVKCGEVVVAEESVPNRFEENMVQSEEERTNGAQYTEEGEVPPTSSMEEDSGHGVHLQSGSPCREVSEAATYRNLGTLDESGERVSNKSMLQTDNPHVIEVETKGANCGNSDDIQYLSSAHFAEESDYQAGLLEVASVNAGVLSQCDSGKDDAVSLKTNTLGKQPADANQDVGWETPAQDFCSTNPFMDPKYITSIAQMDPSSSMSYQPCLSEDEDFLSELLLQHDTMEAEENLCPAADSLWEPATPPDEAPLPSEVMCEEDFRSFYHEYHEIDFTAVTEGFHNESASDANNISNDIVASESDFPCSVSALPVKLDQEACVHSMFDSQLAESSSVNMQAETPISASEGLNDETSAVDSRLKSHESSSDNRSTELDMLSVPVDRQHGQHDFPGIDSCSSPHLLNEETMDEICGSPSSNIVAVEEREIHADLVPRSVIDEKIDGLHVPTGIVVPVEPEVETCGLDEYNCQDVPFCSTSEKKDVLTMSRPVLVQGSEVCVSGEVDCQVMPLSSVDEDTDNLKAPSISTFRAKQESDCLISGVDDSHIPLSSSVCEKIDELDAPPLSNSVLLEQKPEVCVQSGLDSQISPSSSEEKINELDCHPLSTPVLLDIDPEDHVSGDADSQDTPCSLVKNTIDEPKAAQPNSVPVEPEQEIHASPELDSQVAPCSLDGDKIDGPPSCNMWVESQKGPDNSTKINSQIAPCSSKSGVLAETTALTSIMPSTEETYQPSHDPPPTEPFPNVSYDDTQKPPPLPPLQWRLGRPRLGLLSSKAPVHDPARRTGTVLQASSQELGTRPCLLDGMDESVGPVSSQDIKGQMYQSSMLDNNDGKGEFGRLSSDTSENSELRSHTGSVGSVDDKSMDDHNVTDGVDLYTVSPSATGFVSENGYYEQHQHGESFSETSDHREHTSNASEEKNVNHQSITGEAPSDTTNHSAPGPLLEEENSQESQILQEKEVESSQESQILQEKEVENSQESQILQEKEVENSKDDKSVGPLPVAESTSQDCREYEHNLERVTIQQPNPFVVWPGDKSNFGSGLDEGNYVHVEHPPVVGWTVGPQMLHPNYGVLFEENQFGQNITDNRLIRKPISVRNIPRNPLVDAVAAHDRSSMRKVSELAPPSDKPKPNERNLLLEQIRSKTFNLKPVASAKPVAIRSPARGDTRNLKVAAIIEKANAIRQAVGSDDEDGDNWSDT